MHVVELWLRVGMWKGWAEGVWAWRLKQTRAQWLRLNTIWAGSLSHPSPSQGDRVAEPVSPQSSSHHLRCCLDVVLFIRLFKRVDVLTYYCQHLKVISSQTFFKVSPVRTGSAGSQGFCLFNSFSNKNVKLLTKMSGFESWKHLPPFLFTWIIHLMTVRLDSGMSIIPHTYIGISDIATVL